MNRFCNLIGPLIALPWPVVPEFLLVPEIAILACEILLIMLVRISGCPNIVCCS